MDTEGYLRNLTLSFPDGSTATVIVDLPTYRAAIEEEDQSVLDEIIKNYNELKDQTEGAVSTPKQNKGVTQPVHTSDSPVSTPKQDKGVTQPDFNVHTSDTVNWRHEEVLLLISLYSEHQQMFSNSLFKAFEVWKRIAEGMREKGYSFTGLQCDKKFRSLKYRYKTIADANEKSGRGRRKWEFFEAMDELLAGDPSVRPVAVISSSKVTSKPPLPHRTSQPEIAVENRMSTPAKEPSRTGRSATPPARTATPPARAPTPPVRAGTPTTQPSTPEGEPTRKRRRSSTEAPAWFSAFVEEHNRQVEDMLETNRRIAAAAEERNKTLSLLVEALVKNKN